MWANGWLFTPPRPCVRCLPWLAGDKASELGVTKIEHEVVLARFGPGHILALSACIGIQELASWLGP